MSVNSKMLPPNPDSAGLGAASVEESQFRGRTLEVEVNAGEYRALARHYATLTNDPSRGDVRLRLDAVASLFFQYVPEDTLDIFAQPLSNALYNKIATTIFPDKVLSLIESAHNKADLINQYNATAFFLIQITCLYRDYFLELENILSAEDPATPIKHEDVAIEIMRLSMLYLDQIRKAPNLDDFSTENLEVTLTRTLSNHDGLYQELDDKAKDDSLNHLIQYLFRRTKSRQARENPQEWMEVIAWVRLIVDPHSRTKITVISRGQRMLNEVALRYESVKDAQKRTVVVAPGADTRPFTQNRRGARKLHQCLAGCHCQRKSVDREQLVTPQEVGQIAAQRRREEEEHRAAQEAAAKASAAAAEKRRTHWDGPQLSDAELAQLLSDISASEKKPVTRVPSTGGAAAAAAAIAGEPKAEVQETLNFTIGGKEFTAYRLTGGIADQQVVWGFIDNDSLGEKEPFFNQALKTQHINDSIRPLKGNEKKFEIRPKALNARLYGTLVMGLPAMMAELSQIKDSKQPEAMAAAGAILRSGGGDTFSLIRFNEYEAKHKK